MLGASDTVFVRDDAFEFDAPTYCDFTAANASISRDSFTSSVALDDFTWFSHSHASHQPLEPTLPAVPLLDPSEYTPYSSPVQPTINSTNKKSSKKTGLGVPSNAAWSRVSPGPQRNTPMSAVKSKQHGNATPLTKGGMSARKLNNKPTSPITIHSMLASTPHKKSLHHQQQQQQSTSSTILTPMKSFSTLTTPLKSAQRIPGASVMTPLSASKLHNGPQRIVGAGIKLLHAFETIEEGETGAGGAGSKIAASSSSLITTPLKSKGAKRVSVAYIQPQQQQQQQPATLMEEDDDHLPQPQQQHQDTFVPLNDSPDRPTVAMKQTRAKRVSLAHGALTSASSAVTSVIYDENAIVAQPLSTTTVATKVARKSIAAPVTTKPASTSTKRKTIAPMKSSVAAAAITKSSTSAAVKSSRKRRSADISTNNSNSNSNLVIPSPDDLLDPELEAMLHQHNSQITQAAQDDLEIQVMLDAHNKALREAKAAGAGNVSGNASSSSTSVSSSAAMMTSPSASHRTRKSQSSAPSSGGKQPQQKKAKISGGGLTTTTVNNSSPPAVSSSSSLVTRTQQRKSIASTAAAVAVGRKSAAFPSTISTTSSSSSSSSSSRITSPIHTVTRSTRASRNSKEPPVTLPVPSSSSLNDAMHQEEEEEHKQNRENHPSSTATEEQEQDISFSVEDLNLPLVPAPVTRGVRKSMGKALRMTASSAAMVDEDDDDDDVEMLISNDDLVPPASSHIGDIDDGLDKLIVLDDIVAPSLPVASIKPLPVRRAAAEIKFTAAAPTMTARSIVTKRSATSSTTATKGVLTNRTSAYNNTSNANIATTISTTKKKIVVASVVTKPSSKSVKKSTSITRSTTSSSTIPSTITTIGLSSIAVPTSRNKYHSQAPAVIAASSLLSEDNEIAMLLTQHNQQLSQKTTSKKNPHQPSQPKFVARQYSAVQIKAWEQAFQRKWYELSHAEREVANTQIAAMIL